MNLLISVIFKQATSIQRFTDKISAIRIFCWFQVGGRYSIATFQQFFQNFCGKWTFFPLLQLGCYFNYLFWAEIYTESFHINSTLNEDIRVLLCLLISFKSLKEKGGYFWNSRGQNYCLSSFETLKYGYLFWKLVVILLDEI